MGNNDLISFLDSGLNIGEGFEFVGNNVKEEQKVEFRKWVNKSKDFLIESKLVEKDKLEHPINIRDELTEHGLLLAYLRKIYLMETGIM